MQTGCERRPDVDVNRLPRRALYPDGGTAAVEAGWDDGGQRLRGGPGNTGGHAPEPDFGQLVSRKQGVAGDGDAPSFDCPERLDSADSRTRRGVHVDAGSSG